MQQQQSSPTAIAAAHVQLGVAAHAATACQACWQPLRSGQGGAAQLLQLLWMVPAAVVEQEHAGIFATYAAP